MLELHQEYTRGLVRAQDEERKANAAEVHDQLTQQASAMRMRLAMIRGRLEGPPAELEGIVEVEEELGELSGAMRDLAHRMHPKGVDDAGLVNALASLAAELKRDLGVTVHLVHRASPLPIGTPGYAIYRIVQESVRNAVRHGGATEVWVTTRPEDASLLVEIEDRGSGFDPDAAHAFGAPGLGLVTMGERAGVAGGRLAIESRPGRGTVVRAWIPWPEGAPNG